MARCHKRLRARGNPRKYRVSVSSPDSCTNLMEGTARELIRRLKVVTIDSGSITQTGNASTRYQAALQALFA
jgi:hypothetical protein